MRLSLGLLFSAAGLFSGCMAPMADFNAAQTQNRSLTEQNRALQAEAENKNAHVRDLEERLIRAEKQLAQFDQRAEADQKQLESYRREREELYSQLKEANKQAGRPTTYSASRNSEQRQ